MGSFYTSLFYLFLRQSQVYSLPAGMSERPPGGYGASGRLDQVSSLGNAESIVLHGKLGGVTGLEGAVQHLLGHGVFHLALDGPAQGTGPVLGIKALLSQLCHSLVAGIQMDAHGLHPGGDGLQHPPGHFPDVLLRQGAEYDDIVDPV